MSKIKNKILYELDKFCIYINQNSVKWMKQPIIISIDETLETIKSKRASIARYGDGEFDIIFGRKQGFQDNNQVLSKRLREILLKNDVSEHFLVALPDCFNSLIHFTPDAQIHWKLRLDHERIKWVKCLNTKQPYYHAQITRFYFDWADKSLCRNWLKLLKNIWCDEEVVLVEGEYSRVGVGNDLFDNAASVKRILCPAKNAFDYYNEIMNTISQLVSKDNLILIALGPTATVLAYDLFLAGYWAVDVGHIDIEYEWMKIGANEKVKINGKYVNEVKGGNIVSATLSDKDYENEIIAQVGLKNEA